MKKEEETGEKAERKRERERERERKGEKEKENDGKGRVGLSKLERITMKARRWMHFQLTDSLMDKPGPSSMLNELDYKEV